MRVDTFLGPAYLPASSHRGPRGPHPLASALMKKILLIVAAAVTTGVGGLAFAQAQGGQDAADQDTAQRTSAPEGAVQPIQFPHDIHAGTYQMDCQYCHFSASRSVDAGIPPVASCMGCHQTIAGTANPEEVRKVRDYANRGEPIPWVRIYKVADHVHFPHMRHVNAGLACQQCHGPVETMGPIESRDPAWGGDNMGWCVSCHVQEGARRDCTVCHY